MEPESPPSRPLGLTLTVGLLATAFALLGYWQAGRVYRPVDGYSAEPTVVAMDTLVPAGATVPARYVARQVVVSGRYSAAGQQVVAGHDLAGSPVSWVVTYLTLPDRTILQVVRGWLTAGGQALTAVPVGDVTVTGRLESGSPLSQPVGGASPGGVRSGYLIRTAQSPPDPLSLQPVPAAPPKNLAPAEFHLQNAIYVVQWFLLVGVVIFGWWRLRTVRPESDPTRAGSGFVRLDAE